MKKIPFQLIKSCLTFSALIIYLLQSVSFFFLIASNCKEYQESVFFITTGVIYIIVYTLFVVKKSSIQNRMAEFEIIIEESEKNKF